MTEKASWLIYYSSKAKKLARKLPARAKMQLDLLAKQLETQGPYRKDWPHYGPLGKGPGIPENAYHCHIQSGRPTYGVCWLVEDKKLKIIEIFYVDTHENSPYWKQEQKKRYYQNGAEKKNPLARCCQKGNQ